MGFPQSVAAENHVGARCLLELSSGVTERRAFFGVPSNTDCIATLVIVVPIG